MIVSKKSLFLAMTFLIAASFSSALAQHRVWDHVWSDTEVWWTTGLWTRDGRIVCRTFDTPSGTVHTGGPNPRHQWDHADCPEWPNDWHWTAQFEWRDRFRAVHFWFEFSAHQQLDVPLYSTVDLEEFSFLVDTDADTYTITAADETLVHRGAWSRYPADLPDGWEPIDASRRNFGEAATLYFPQFADGAAGRSSISSSISLISLCNDTSANAVISIRDDTGAPMTVDLNGVEVSGTTEVVVPPGSSITLKTDGEGPLQSGSVVVTSDVELAGVILYDAGPIGAAGVGASEMLRKFVAPVQTLENSRNTGVAVMGSDEDQVIDFELVDDQRNLQGRASVRVATGGHFARFVTELPWDPMPDFSSFSGTLTAIGTSDFAATVILVTGSEFATLPVGACKEYCVGTVVAVAPGDNCAGLKKGDLACVPCPKSRECENFYDCVYRRGPISGVCAISVDVDDQGCRACPGGATRLDPPKGLNWGWACKGA